MELRNWDNLERPSYRDEQLEKLQQNLKKSEPEGDSNHGALYLTCELSSHVIHFRYTFILYGTQTELRFDHLPDGLTAW